MSCPDCFRGAIHDHAEPKGHFETMHGLKTYVAGGEGSQTKKSSILFIPDAFSFRLINNKILADRYAEETGCQVLFPDIVPDGGADPALIPKMETAFAPLPTWTFGAIIAKVKAIISIFPFLLKFIFKTQPSKHQHHVLAYARAMREDLPTGGKLGVAGFCWGGYGSTLLCTEPAEEGGEKRLIDAQFNGHPSALKVPDQIVDAITKYRVPYSSAVGAEDFMFGEKAAQETEAVLRQKLGPPEKNDYEFVVYKGCKHGFCVRAVPDEKSMEGYDQAATQAVNWFNKYLV